MKGNCLICKKRLTGKRKKYCSVCSIALNRVRTNEGNKKSWKVRQAIWNALPQEKKNSLIKKAVKFYYQKAKENEKSQNLKE